MISLLVFLGCSIFEPPPVRPPIAAPTAITTGRTSVLVVMLDTVRADHLGLYGYKIGTSPNLDAFAKSSVVFDQHIANSSWTRPSMGSVFTGLYPHTLGLYEERYDRLDPEFTLLSERFRDHGYVTLGVTSNPNMNNVFGFNQGFDAYGESGVVFKWMQDTAKRGKHQWSKFYPLEDATVMTDRALAMLDAHADRLVDTPFYLQVVYIDPHYPYTQPPAHEAAVKGSKKPGYDGGIHYIDTELNRLFEQMEERGHLQDTLILITGDHGEGLWSHPGVPNSAWHGNTLYDSVLHVPMIVSHPTLEPKRIGELSQGLDIVPTVAGLLGWEPTDDLPGSSLAPSILGDGPVPPDRIVFSETDFRQNRKYSARTATHKLIRNDDVQLFAKGIFEGKALTGLDRKQIAGGLPEEFYDLEAGAELPRFSKPGGPEADRLRRALADWEAAYPRRPASQHDPKDLLTQPDGTTVRDGSGGEVELDEATKNALKALGYLDE